MTHNYVTTHKPLLSLQNVSYSLPLPNIIFNVHHSQIWNTLEEIATRTEKSKESHLKYNEIIARGGFEPPSRDPESPMIDRYTTGLFLANNTHITDVIYNLFGGRIKV